MDIRHFCQGKRLLWLPFNFSAHQSPYEKKPTFKAKIRSFSLQKHTYSNTLKILLPKMTIFQIKKKSDIYHISAQNIDCGYSLEPLRRGGSNEYPQSMFCAEKIKNNVYPCKPQFYYIKVGFKGIKIIYSRTSMARTSLGPWKFVRDVSSSSHWGLIMALVQETNSDNLGKCFQFSKQWLYIECIH